MFICVNSKLDQVVADCEEITFKTAKATGNVTTDSPLEENVVYVDYYPM